MRLRMMRYAPTIKYIRGSANNLADALSRTPVHKPSSEDVQFVLEVQAEAKESLPDSPMIRELREAQAQDAVCQEVKRCIKEGWSLYKNDADTTIHP
jgi:hypothetical protein